MTSRRSFTYRWLAAATAASVVAAGVFAAASTMAARSARDEAATRPVVLFLHGRGQLGRDTAGIRAEWQQALETGLGGLTRRPLIGPGDLRLVWYADLLDPGSSVRACDGRDTRPPRRRAERTGQADGDVLELLLGITGALFTSLYESMPEESRYSMRAIVGDVLYLGDRWRRCAVDRRLESALAWAAREERPVVLVAHSFGSLVAYSYLRGDRTRSTTPAIHRYVTLGSMLGIPELQQLLLGSAGSLSLPEGVGSWVNVRHTADPFAVSLADSATKLTAGVREVVIRGAAADPHDIRTYLRDPAAARVIAWAWCDAFRRSRPAGCGDLQRDAP